jgi:adenylate cyclase
MRIPISTKLIALTVSILIGATALIAQQSAEFFQKVMTQREDDSNNTSAISLANQIKLLLNNSYEKANVVSSLMLRLVQEKAINLLPPGTPSADVDELVKKIEKVESLASLEIYKVSTGVPELVYRKTSDKFLDSQQISKSYFDDLRRKSPFPIKSLTQKNFQIRNSTLPKGPALITMGFPIARGENDVVSHVALADFQLSLIQKPFGDPGVRIFYLFDENGDLLAHQDEQKALAHLNMKTSPLVQKSIASTASNMQIRFVDPDLDKHFIGAFQKIPAWGVTVVAQTAEEIILEPAQQVRRKAYYISGIVISIALFLCFLFSMTLTSPIEKLAELIKLVAKGNFNVKAKLVVNTNDEVRDLAVAFDHMTDGLKERDKVKSLFSKFHGSTIAEDLIKNDIGVGGTKKEVTIFFSDIRGFTKFSEGHTPEQVVAMLNEYFGKMVKIINKNGGVVDKFIGDAIMAVWGAPHGTVMDTHNALKSCLEMRVALNELNQTRRKRGQSDIMIGMGLHCGPAISGTIGSEERMEYTVIGDTVNMTSRIEASTKAFGSDLLVSQAVAEKVGNDFLMEVAGSAEVKGKSEPLKLFKVRGYRDASGNVIKIKTEFSDFAPEAADKVKIAG